VKEKTASLVADALEKTLETIGLSAKELAEVILGCPIPARDKRSIGLALWVTSSISSRSSQNPTKNN